MSSFSATMVRLMDQAWMRLAWLLGQIVPRILLAIIFYLILTPLALMAKLIGEKDPLQLKNPGKSLFKEGTSALGKESFEKMW